MDCLLGKKCPETDTNQCPVGILFKYDQFIWGKYGKKPIFEIKIWSSCKSCTMIHLNKQFRNSYHTERESGKVIHVVLIVQQLNALQKCLVMVWANGLNLS